MATAREATMRDTLAKNVRALMTRRGWTQAQVGQKAGISQTHVGNILRREVEPTAKMITGLAKAFGVEQYALLMPGIPVEILDSNEIPAMLRTWLATRWQGPIPE